MHKTKKNTLMCDAILCAGSGQPLGMYLLQQQRHRNPEPSIIKWSLKEGNVVALLKSLVTTMIRTNSNERATMKDVNTAVMGVTGKNVRNIPYLYLYNLKNS